MLEDLFPSRIKRLRKERKMTQQKLAITIGVDVRTIKRWERGDHWPGPADIQALAKALGVRIRDLFDFPEYPEI